MIHNDLSIIGGSFAGLACARAAATQGLNTVVFERKSCPGERVRTTGILVKEAADILRLPSHLGRAIGGVRLYSPNGAAIDLASPGYSFIATDTPGMMRWLTQQAELVGVDVRLSKNITRFHREGDRIVLPEAGLRSRYLVGCDGARSSVAKRFGLSANRQFLLGVEAEYEGIRDLDPDRLHVFLDSVHAPGYIGWIVPGVGIQQVGLAVRQPHQPDLAAFTAKIARLIDFSQARIIGRRGGLIPCGGVLPRWHDQQVMLLGDSAGMVSPLTAGGIFPSLQIGASAGDAIGRHLRGETDDPGKLVAELVPNYRFKGLMRWSMDHITPPNLLYDLALQNPVFRRVAQILFFHHRGLFCAKAWREIMGMLPASAGARS